MNITHTYIGDLQVSLEHAGRTLVLHDHEGGSQDNLVQEFEVQEFARQDASGLWTLTVADHAYHDEGTLDGWALLIAPQTRSMAPCWCG